jgi:hypothetical protein
MKTRIIQDEPEPAEPRMPNREGAAATPQEQDSQRLLRHRHALVDRLRTALSRARSGVNDADHDQRP